LTVDALALYIKNSFQNLFIVTLAVIAITFAKMNVSQLSEKQREIFDKFLIKISDCRSDAKPQDDSTFLRWLVARNFDEDEAEKMLRNSLEWRKKNQIDDILDNWQVPEVLEKYYSMGVCGNDKYGCPLWISAYGNTDMKGILMSVNKKSYVRYFAYITEKSAREMERLGELTGKPVTTQTVIMDMENLSSRQMSYKPVREVGVEVTKMFDGNYPENLRRVFIVNAPKIFTFAFSMVRPLLSQVTLDKIKVFGTDREQWTEALLQDIDADQLPVHYGGTMTDPNGDPKCPSKFNMGGPVPQSHYFSCNKPVPTDDMVFATVPSGNKLKIKFEVTAPIILK